jgi:hypothetical protein
MKPIRVLADADLRVKMTYDTEDSPPKRGAA